jgi:hypothetical protein
MFLSKLMLTLFLRKPPMNRMLPRLSAILLACALLVLVPVTVAQFQIPPIDYDESVDGEFSVGNALFMYAFNGTEGDVITITLTVPEDSEIALQLSLLGMTDGQIAPLAQHLDAPIGTSSLQITEFALPETNRYFIEVVGLQGSSAYTLTLALSDNDNEPFFDVPDGWHYEQVDLNNYLMVSNPSLMEFYFGDDDVAFGTDDHLINLYPYDTQGEYTTPDALLEAFLDDFDSLQGEDVITQTVGTYTYARQSVSDSGLDGFVYAIPSPDSGMGFIAIVISGDLEAVAEIMDTLIASIHGDSLLAETPHYQNFRVTVPDGWLVEADNVSYTLGSSQAALESLGRQNTLGSGEIMIDFVWFSDALLKSLGIDSQSYAEMLEGLLPIPAATGTTSEATLSGDVPVAITFVDAINGQPENMVLLLTPAEDGKIFWWVQYGLEDAFEDVEPILYEVILSLTYEQTPVYP